MRFARKETSCYINADERMVNMPDSFCYQAKVDTNIVGFPGSAQGVRCFLSFIYPTIGKVSNQTLGNFFFLSLAFCIYNGL